METIFLFCAIFGGTVLVAQLALGFGGGGDDGDHDLDDMGGDASDVHDIDAGGHDGDAHDGDAHDQHADSAHHGSTWVFGVLTFRTVMIGLTFFGLTGKAAMASGFGQPKSLAIAVGCALAAMYGVYFLMRGLYKLTADGTERIGRAVGEEGIVYLTIPGHSEGIGKVQVSVQNRTVEYEAMTAGEKLPTGARIVVVGVLSSSRVEVEPVTEPARNTHV